MKQLLLIAMLLPVAAFAQSRKACQGGSINDCNQLIAASPSDTNLYDMRAEAYFIQAEENTLKTDSLYKHAIADFEKVLELNPACVDCHYNLFRAYFSAVRKYYSKEPSIYQYNMPKVEAESYLKKAQQELEFYYKLKPNPAEYNTRLHMLSRLVNNINQ